MTSTRPKYTGRNSLPIIDSDRTLKRKAKPDNEPSTKKGKNNTTQRTLSDKQLEKELKELNSLYSAKSNKYRIPTTTTGNTNTSKPKLIPIKPASTSAPLMAATGPTVTTDNYQKFTPNSETSEESLWNYPRKPVKSPQNKNKIDQQATVTGNRYELLQPQSDPEMNTDNEMNRDNELINVNSQSPTAVESTPITPETAHLSKKKRPPPIHVAQTSINDLGRLINKLPSNPKGKFYVSQPPNKTYTNIFALDMNIYTEIIQLIKSKKMDYYTYTPKENKPKSIVIKNLLGNYSNDDITNEIKSLNLNNVEVIKTSEIFLGKNEKRNKHHLIQLTNASNEKALFNVKYLLNQKIKWEFLHKQDPFQCIRCQRYGHSSANCSLPYRCVKCSLSHEPGNCTLDKNSEKSLLHCANCERFGHPANYKGCPSYKEANDKIKLNQIKKNENIINKVTKLTNNNLRFPAISYANALSQDNSNSNTIHMIPNNPPNFLINPTHTTSDVRESTHNIIHNEQDSPPAWAIKMQEHIISSSTARITQLENYIEIINKQVNENAQNIENILTKINSKNGA